MEKASKKASIPEQQFNALENLRKDLEKVENPSIKKGRLDKVIEAFNGR